MKKLIALSIICLIALSGIAQEKRKDKMIQRFEEIKAELNLTEEQDAAIKKLFRERQAALKESKPALEPNLSEEEKNKEKMEAMKKRKEINQSLRTKIEAVLTEEQKAKMKELMPQKRKILMEEKEAKPRTPHKHKDGAEHSH